MEMITKNNNISDLTPGAVGMMKARMALDSHFGNKTARRMTNYDTRSYVFPDSVIPVDPIYGPARGNVYVGNQDNWVIPHIKDVNGQLQYVGWDDYKDQNMRIETPEDAQYFAEHYKEIAPMMYIQDVPFMYNNNQQKLSIRDSITRRVKNILMK